MLTIKNLSFAYGSIQTLNSVDMEMETGKVTCILGRNGVGKTTLIRMITGEETPDAGTIELGETVKLTYVCLLYTSPSPRDKRQSRMPSSA